MNTAILQALEHSCNNAAIRYINIAERKLAANQDAGIDIGQAKAYQEMANTIADIIKDLQTD